MPKTKAPITPRQVRFIEEYVVDCDATNAAIRAGYSERTSYQIGHALLGKRMIADAIAAARAKLARKADVTAERVVKEFAIIGFFDPAVLYDERGDLLPIQKMPEDSRRAITGIDVEELFEGKGDERRAVGRIRKIRFAQKQQALDSLAKHLGLFSDDDAPVNQTVILQQINQLIDEQASTRMFEARMSRELGRQVSFNEIVAMLRQQQPPAPNGKPVLRLVGPVGDEPGTKDP